MLRKDEQKLVDDCIRFFDFEKVEKTMKALNWKWCLDGVRVPTQADMVIMSQGLCATALKDYRNTKARTYSACGGFEAEVYPAIPDGFPILELRFVVADWTTDPR